MLRPSGAISTEVLYAMVAYDPSFYSELLGGVTGTTGSRQRVKPADVLASSVPIFDSDALMRLSDQLSGVQNLAGRLHVESSRLRALRDELLPKLVSGRIRVRDSREVIEAGNGLPDLAETAK